MSEDRDVFDHLLAELERMHCSDPAISDFCPFPNDITAQPVNPFHIAACDLFESEAGLFTQTHQAQRDALIDAAPFAHWRETYKDTDIGQDFMERFGCYCVIGDEGPFASATMRAWMVYMPANLHYPWHHHPAEEAYLVLAGEAKFLRDSEPPRILRAGKTSLHQSNQPHAMTTYEHPVLAYVIWRNGFETPPVLTPC